MMRKKREEKEKREKRGKYSFFLRHLDTTLHTNLSRLRQGGRKRLKGEKEGNNYNQKISFPKQSCGNKNYLELKINRKMFTIHTERQKIFSFEQIHQQQTMSSIYRNPHFISYVCYTILLIKPSFFFTSERFCLQSGVLCSVSAFSQETFAACVQLQSINVMQNIFFKLNFKVI